MRRILQGAPKYWLLVILLTTLPVMSQEYNRIVSPADTSSVLRSDSLENLARQQQIAEQEPRRIVRRHFDHKEQIRLALFMMTFVVLMITTADQYNP